MRQSRYLVGVIIHEQDPVHVLEPLVQGFHCVPLLAAPLHMLSRHLLCVAPATNIP